ncbi:MAG TPA: Mur ligase domain-containing protein, partial [Bacteroidales bacterium]|nr:Mur ligase domain-containing protein [Bacteroidales bacterium]
MGKTIYFLGIGGIGMSALARFYLQRGERVVGYDHARTALTDSLQTEGA